MDEFVFTFAANLAQLQTEIENSFITIAIDEIFAEDEHVHVNFKANLSAEEQVMLTAIVDAHVPQPNVEEEPQSVQLSQLTETDGIPYVYATSKPLDHYVCYQGAGDLFPHQYAGVDGLEPHVSQPEITGIGKGDKLTFRVSSKTDELVKYFSFNQSVYIKDGYMIAKEAPFGATFDIDVVHPQLGAIFPFGRNVPIFGTGWFPLNTEDRGFLPIGMQIRITMRNSNGSETNHDEDTPATFNVFGRFELYRPKPPGF